MSIKSRIAAIATTTALAAALVVGTVTPANAGQIDKHGFSSPYSCNLALTVEKANIKRANPNVKFIWAYCYYVKSKHQYYLTIAW